jgi:hypothetical protein
MHVAYLEGRNSSNPADGWYKGELWFFDNYIIPLAKKLRECKVFGVSCDELLNYAIDNRNEWQAKGEEIVAELVEQASKSSGRKGSQKAAVGPPPLPPLPDKPEDCDEDDKDDSNSNIGHPVSTEEEEPSNGTGAASASTLKQQRLFL